MQVMSASHGAWRPALNQLQTKALSVNWAHSKSRVSSCSTAPNLSSMGLRSCISSGAAVKLAQQQVCGSLSAPCVLQNNSTLWT